MRLEFSRIWVPGLATPWSPLRNQATGQACRRVSCLLRAEGRLQSLGARPQPCLQAHKPLFPGPEIEVGGSACVLCGITAG